MQSLEGTAANGDEVVEMFKTYLERHGYRKTPERFAILSEIYKRDDHFDAEALYVHMKTSDYHVSRATVYNTLDLLTQCDLILKHHFDGQVTRYEKAYGVPDHSHLICSDCGKIYEFVDPRLQAVCNDLAATSDTIPERFEFIVYGKCQEGCNGNS